MCILGSMRTTADGGVGNYPTVPWIKVIIVIHSVTAHSMNSYQPSKRLFLSLTEITALMYHEWDATFAEGKFS